MRKRGKVDLNQPEIVDALRKVGATIQSLANIGNGCPDILVGHDGVWYVIEIKNGNLAPSKQRLTSDEDKWHQSAQTPVHVVNSVAEALKIILK